MQVTDTGAKSWLYRYECNGKGHWHGIGALPNVTLAMAREKAIECRRLRDDGVDPIEHARSQKAVKRTESSRGKSFRECALAYIEAHAPGWKNARHAAQWSSTLESYAFPVIGDLRVQHIDVELVLKVLEPRMTEAHDRYEQLLIKDGARAAQTLGHIGFKRVTDKLCDGLEKDENVEGAAIFQENILQVMNARKATLPEDVHKAIQDRISRYGEKRA